MRGVPLPWCARWTFLVLVLPISFNGCGKDKTTGPPNPPPQLTSPRIAFTSDRGGVGGIHLYDPSTGGIVRLTPIGSIDQEPAISPDGRRIAFVSSSGGIKRLMTMAVNGGGRLPVLSNAQLAPANPHWSPDSKKIVFTGTSQSGAMDVYTILASGDSLEPVTTDGWSRVFAWAPDGSRILYAYQNTTLLAPGDSLRDILPSGSGMRHIFWTGPSYTVLGADYSPDGSQIVFDWIDVPAGNTYKVEIMNSDGSNLHFVAQDVPDIAGLSQPSWSPDGSTIVFSAHPYSGGSNDLYTVTPSPADAQLLLGGTAVDEDPDWGPRP